ncbi:hypothetical protein D3C84_641410 [compost metagenome]
MDMHRVMPAAARADQFPDFATALPNFRADLLDVEDPVIDRPQTALAAELPAPHSRVLQLLGGDGPQLAQFGRDSAVVGGGAVDHQLEDRRARRADVLRAASALLTQAVDQVQLGAQRVLGEVDNDVAALGHAQFHLGLVVQRRRKQVAVVGDVGE